MLANSAGDTNQGPQPMTMGDLRTEQSSRSDSELDPLDILPELCGPPSTESLSDMNPQVGDLLLDVTRSHAPHNPEVVKNYTPDPASQAKGERILKEKEQKNVQSRILKDPFHVFNMFYISAAHGLLYEFAIALRDAIFIPDQTDKSRIIAWGQTQNPPQAWDDILFKRADWLWRRCKRIIPPAEELYPLVAKVFETFGPLKDAKSGLPLFNITAWAVAKNILELIQKGFLSDPPGIPLYYQVGIDGKTGLPLYCCMRGTNMTEGGVHTHLCSRLPPEIRLKTAMGAYVPSLHGKQPHHFLASIQGTRKPVLPIHNQEERDLFHELLTNDTGFSDPISGPNWDLAVQL
jgi:hypothetical protein